MKRNRPILNACAVFHSLVALSLAEHVDRKDYYGPTVDDGLSTLNTDTNPRAVIAELSNSHRTHKNAPLKVHDAKDREYQDRLHRFLRLKCLNAALPLGGVTADPREGKETEAVYYLRKHHLPGIVFRPAFYADNNRVLRCSELYIEAQPFAHRGIIMQLQESGLFAFVSRYMEGAGGLAVTIIVPRTIVFPGKPNSQDGQRFVAGLVAEAFSLAKGYVVPNAVKTEKPFRYSFDVIGRGDSFFSGDASNWDKAHVDLSLGEDGYFEKPGMVEIGVDVDATFTKGPKHRLPPAQRFKPFPTNPSDVETAVANILIGSHGWEIL